MKRKKSGSAAGQPNFIDETFRLFRKSGKKVLIGYITAGFPSKASFQDLVARLQRAGIDLLEIGVPFSDPVADGPTIQGSSQKALKNGVTLEWILESLAGVREIHIPTVLMAYSNSIVAMGIERFFDRAHAAGVSGVVIPDLILEEGRMFGAAAAKNRVALIYLAAPTTLTKRLKRIAAATEGFLYVVSSMGITGARKALPSDLKGFLRKVRRLTPKPIAVGFGISTPLQVRSIKQWVDGVIVGSALINHLQSSVGSAERFVASLQKALNNSAG